MPSIVAQAQSHDMRERIGRLGEALQADDTGTFRGWAGQDGDDEPLTADVDAAGTLLSMEISPVGFRDLDATALGVACTEALDNARSRLAEHLQLILDDLIAEVVGDRQVPALPRVTNVDDMLRHAKEVERSWSQEWTRLSFPRSSDDSSATH
jgi:hypothetical protein